MILNDILPALPAATDMFARPCYYAFGLAPDGKKRKTTPCFSIRELIEACGAFMGEGWNSYFAQAAFADAAMGRKQTNATQFKAFWIDIDVGKARNSYPDRESAVAGLTEFVKATRLQPTYIISSGMGFYAYWCLTESISAARWKKLATWLAEVLAAKGLIVDPACTKDEARVLRMPCTIHQKSGNKVEVMGNSKRLYDWQEFAELLYAVQPPSWQGVPQASIQETQGNALFGSNYGVGNDTIRAYAEPIVKGCEQIRTAGLGSEPQWYAMMSVMKRCIDGYDWAHKLSAEDTARYDMAGTDAKYQHAPDNSPCRCQTFDNLNPGVCNHCPYWGQLTSPIQLWRKQGAVAQAPVDSRQIEPAEPETTAPAEYSRLVLPTVAKYKPLSFHSPEFFVDASGVHWLEPKKDKNTGAYYTEDQIITQAQLYYLKSIWSYDNGKSTRWHWFLLVTPDGRRTEVCMNAEVLASSQAIMSWFSSNNVFPTSGKYGAKVFMNFMNAYLSTVLNNKQLVEVNTADTFGWKDANESTGQPAGFACGEGLVTDSGVTTVEYTGVANRLAQTLKAKGTVEGWKPVAQMYKTLDQKAAQLAVCMSFAAPLMKYGSGVATSATFSMWSTQSGMGKTQLLRAAASVWGHPDGQFIQRQSSAVARMRQLAVLNNMPAFMDELTDVSDEDLYSLAYSLVGGMEKNKLRRNGVDMMATGSWNTVTFITSNKSIKEAVAHCAGDSAASVARVIEYECDFLSYTGQPKVQEYINACIAQCATNYGVAGPNFIHNVMRHADRLATLTEQCEKWAIANGFTNDERFMSYPLALALKAGRWACEWGLLEYDMDALEKWVLQVFVPHNRKGTRAQVRTSQSVLLSYLMERQRNFLQVEEDVRTSEVPAPNMPDPYVRIRPSHNDVFIRFATKERRLYIAKSDLANWCKRAGLSANNLIKKLRKDDGIDVGEALFNLGSGVSSISTPMIMCYVFDASAVVKLGFNVSMFDKAKPVTNVAPQVL